MIHAVKRAATVALISLATLAPLGTVAHASPSATTDPITIQAPYWQPRGPFGDYSRCISERTEFRRYYLVTDCYMYNGSWWFDYKDR
ncbi:hypothetical protein [Nonomuraea recticatena]|uniref:Uncharacterized protein n=1 Tax=Nonomuraea recticatena TaxID=46178 RepID=A0ABN3SI18_9ACTN